MKEPQYWHVFGETGEPMAFMLYRWAEEGAQMRERDEQNKRAGDPRNEFR